MTKIPTGVVTFLFTDIEGSTKLAQEFPDKLPFALEKHHSILREAFESNKGFIFQIVGDAFSCAFENTDDAVKAAIDAQINLSRENWDEAEINVRMGIHSGNAKWDGKKYMEYITLARTARIMSAAYGEQILISNDAYKLLSVTNREIRNEYDQAEISFRDLGERRLKDVIQPIRLFQIVSSPLREDFPPLKTLDARPNNLPVQLTSFIGRDSEMKLVKDLLKQTHLLTLTGSGGCGKTRLSLQVAADVIDDFPNGVWFVELASLFEPTLLPQAIMKVFDLKEEPKRNLEVTLCDYLKDKEILIILDNCEHLINDCAKLTEKLLSNCLKLKIIATSREALRCEGEQTHRVLSLDTPNPKEEMSPEKLSQYEAVRLFIERASQVDENFRVNNENAPALAEICYQLDGIPLAIELAAARTKVLSVEKIFERLSDRFNLLKGGKRTALPRQQTLRALIDWSYDLLSMEEKILLARLSVFAGGWTLEAAEQICSDEKIRKEEVLELLNHLIEKSIILFEKDKERFRILESLKQYGEEKLKSSKEAEVILSKHLHYYMEFSEAAEPKLRESKVQIWLEKINLENGNMEKALHYSIMNDITKGTRLVLALYTFWFTRGDYSGTKLWMENIIKNFSAIPNTLRAKILSIAGNCAHSLGENEKARRFVEESLSIRREDGDKKGIADCFFILGKIATEQGEYSKARKILEESLSIFKELGEKRNIANAYFELSVLSKYVGDYKLAFNFVQEALTLYRKLGNKAGVASSLTNLGTLANFMGQYENALKSYYEGLSVLREIGDKGGLAITLGNLGLIYSYQGKYETAFKIFEESLMLHREMKNNKGIALTLHNLGMDFKDLGEYDKAQKHFEESIIIFQRMGAEYQIAFCINSFGNLNLLRGRFGEAKAQFEHSYAIFNKIGAGNGIALSSYCLGNVAFELYNYEDARKFFEKSLSLRRELGEKKEIINSILGLTRVQITDGHYKKAANLLGFIETVLNSMQAVLERYEKIHYEKAISNLYKHLSKEEFSRQYEQGKVMTVDQAMELALKKDS